LTGALATALILSALWSGHLLIERNRLRDELARSSANDASKQQSLEKFLADERQRNEQLKAEIEKLSAQQTPSEPSPSPSPAPTVPIAQPAFVTFQLISSLVRNEGNKIPELKISPGTGQVRLQMSFTSGDYKHGHVVIRNIDAVNTWQQVGL